MTSFRNMQLSLIMFTGLIEWNHQAFKWHSFNLHGSDFKYHLAHCSELICCSTSLQLVILSMFTFRVQRSRFLYAAKSFWQTPLSCTKLLLGHSLTHVWGQAVTVIECLIYPFLIPFLPEVSDNRWVARAGRRIWLDRKTLDKASTWLHCPVRTDNHRNHVEPEGGSDHLRVEL